MGDLILSEFMGKALSSQDLERLLREEATKLLGSDSLSGDPGKRKGVGSSQGLRRSIGFFREVKRSFTFSRKGLRTFTLR